jgi:hypothetical protein
MGKIDVRSCAGRAGGRSMAASLLLALLAGCSVDGLVGDAPLPADVTDPAVTETPDGALAVYRGTLSLFAAGFGGVSAGFAPTTFIAATGLLGDELQDGSRIGAPFSAAGLDVRLLPEQTDPSADAFTGAPSIYAQLQKVRGQAQEALGLLRDFPPQASPALQAHVYALEGYSEVLLADLFCSGIPLSTLDYKGDFTVKPGSSTADVYQHAAALFDTALTLAGDSARFAGLAQVGKGRALLALGQFAQAAAAVQTVPDGYTYTVHYVPAPPVQRNFAGTPGGNVNIPWDFSVADREGGNGLDYRSSADPRTASTSVGPNLFGVELFHPDKYATDGSSPIVLADWVEARLIEAEAALQAGDATTWLAKLNHLRETAITPALADTTDPGTPDARVDLTFRERAFWLFLTGHRQGDLRRLIRQYGRSPNLVYPVGIYPGGLTTYGGDVTAPIPADERASNPQFTGCLNRGA